MAKAVVVHDLGQAEAALAAAAALRQPIAIWSAPDTALRAGVGWFAAVARQSPMTSRFAYAVKRTRQRSKATRFLDRRTPQ